MKWYVLNYPSEEDKLNRIVELIKNKLKLESGILIKIPFLKIKENVHGRTVQHRVRMFPGYGFLGISDNLKKEVHERFLRELDSYEYPVRVLKYSCRDGWRYYALNREEWALILNMERGLFRGSSKVKKGDVVRIEKGLFEGFDGIVERVRRDEIFVSIVFLGKVSLIRTDVNSVRLLGKTDLVRVLESRNYDRDISKELELER